MVRESEHTKREEKKGRTLSILLCLFLVLSGLAMAQSITNVREPVPGSTLTDDLSIDFEFLTEDPTTGCWLTVGLSNGSYHAGNSTRPNLTTTKTVSSTEIVFNRTESLPIDSGPGLQHNWSVWCGTDLESSTKISTFVFSLEAFKPTITLPTNDSTDADGLVPLRATTNNAINLSGGDVCQYQLGLTNGTLLSYQNLNVSGSANTTFVNGSVIPMANSTVGEYHNVTIKCDYTGGESVSTTTFFKTDTVNPTIVRNNATASSGTLTLNLTIIDNTTSTCSITADGTSLTTSLTEESATMYCTASLTGDSVGQDGNFTVEYDATDLAGNTATNITKDYTRTTLTEGWNLVGWAQNQTDSANACSMISGCTSLSWYNNTAKTFTTYTTSAPTVNNATDIQIGHTILVKVSADTTFVQEDFYPAAWDNTSLFTGWNTFSISEDANLTAVLNQVNVTTASYYNGSNYLTCASSTLCTQGITDSDTISLVESDAVWILTDANNSINRSGVTN